MQRWTGSTRRCDSGRGRPPPPSLLTAPARSPLSQTEALASLCKQWGIESLDEVATRQLLELLSALSEVQGSATDSVSSYAARQSALLTSHCALALFWEEVVRTGGPGVLERVIGAPPLPHESQRRLLPRIERRAQRLQVKGFLMRVSVLPLLEGYMTGLLKAGRLARMAQAETELGGSIPPEARGAVLQGEWGVPIEARPSPADATCLAQTRPSRRGWTRGSATSSPTCWATQRCRRTSPAPGPARCRASGWVTWTRTGSRGWAWAASTTDARRCASSASTSQPRRRSSARRRRSRVRRRIGVRRPIRVPR